MSIRDISLVQLGLGGVGRALVEQVIQNRERHSRELRLQLNHIVVADSDGFLTASTGLSDDQLMSASDVKASGERIKDLTGGQVWDGTSEQLFDQVNSEPIIVIDVSATNATIPILRAACQRDWGIALANKLPLADTYEIFSELTASRRTKYETTVAAALPVISTLQSYLLDTGDSIKRVWGCVSGTMNMICQRLEAGEKFSSIIRDAKAHGHTEPDPREDIGGRDSTRKALILARLLGQGIEFGDVKAESLYPADWDGLTVDEFMERLPELNEEYDELSQKASSDGLKLRYMVEVEGSGCSAALKTLSPEDDIIRPSVADSVVAITSERYSQNPMLIRGRGSGPRLTASGVLSDILQIAQML